MSGRSKHRIPSEAHSAFTRQQLHRGRWTPSRETGAGLIFLLASLLLIASAVYPVHSPPTGKYFDYVVTILMENQDLPSVLAQGPYQASLAAEYTLATGYSAVGHPSEPNYLALISGQTFNPPSGDDGYHVFTAANLMDGIEAKGLTWHAWSESATRPCDTGNPDIRHIPFLFFADIANNQTRCNNIVPSTAGTDQQLITALQSPTTAFNYMWLTPNDKDNSHDTPISTGDAFLSHLVPQILNSTVFKTQRAVLFIVYDEGNNAKCTSGGPDCVYASWSGSAAKKAFRSSSSYIHYSYLRTIEDDWNIGTMTPNDASANPMVEFFGPSGTPLRVSYTDDSPAPMVNTSITFTGNITGGTSPYTSTYTFGDGTRASGPSTTHSYLAAGTFLVVLAVTDATGNLQTASQNVTVTNPPGIPGGGGGRVPLPF